jgi:TolA-binding protein
VQAQAAVSDLDPRSAEFELSVYNHANKLLTAHKDDWCCIPAFSMPNRWDYLDLISELAETTLLRHVEFWLKTQGDPDRATQLLARYESIYRDHPAFTSVRAWTDWTQAEKRQGPERESLRRQAMDAALRAMYWSQGQTWAAWDGLRLRRKDSMVDRGPPTKAEWIWTALSNGYIGDWPIRWYWPTWEQGGDPELAARNAIERVAYSSHTFSNLTEAMDLADEVQKKQLVEQAARRFAGDPDRVAFLVDQGAQASDPTTKRKIYEEAVQATPNAWEPYFQLGQVALQEGDYATALKTFQRYPGFAVDSKRDKVALSQYAFAAASELYWRGAIPEAVALFKLSAGYDTGSWGSMTSATRLMMLEGDYRGAAMESLQRAQRYRQKYAYRDFLDLLHVLGRSEDAWAVFRTLMEQFPTPEIWHSAYVGLRIKGTSNADFETWLLSDGIRRAHFDHYRFAPHLAILWNVVDRKPGSGFVRLVEQLDSPPQYFVEPNGGWTVHGDPVSNPQGAGLRIVGPSPYKAEGRPKRAAGTVLRSSLAYFADAYKLLRDKDFAGATRVFEEMTTHYTIENTYAGPYFARAAAKSGNGEALERHLDSSLAEHPNMLFEVSLAKAFFAGARGEHEEALKHLNVALNNRPHTESRPIFTEYQFAEACEWLYQDTGKATYRDLALDWVRKYQRLAPMYSWAYAIEARLTPSPARRIRALAITLYLDPKSERASTFTLVERQRAKEWLKANNPFLKEPATGEDA